MIASSSPQISIVAWSATLNIGIGFGLAIFGNRLFRKGEPFSGVGLFLLVSAVVTDWMLHLQTPGAIGYYWKRNWVSGLLGEPMVQIGAFLDRNAVISITLISLLSAALVVLRRIYIDEPNLHRVYAAINIGTGAVSLLWLAVTPWMALFWIGLIFIAGLFALSTRWDQNTNEAHLISWYMIEMVVGMALFALGLASLTSVDAQLDWVLTSVWYPYGGIHVGGIALFAGLIVLTKTFPTSRFLFLKSNGSYPIQLYLVQLLMSWGVFGLIFRFYGHFDSVGLFPTLGWVAVGAAILNHLLAIFQRDWRRSLNLFSSSMAASVIAATAFAGVQSGMALMIGSTLGIFGMAIAGESLSQKTLEDFAGKTRARWLKVSLFMNASLSVGVVGFVSAHGIIRWLSSVQSNPAHSAVVAIITGLGAFIAFKTCWQLAQSSSYCPQSWALVIVPYLFILFGLSIIWTGQFTGGVINEGAQAYSIFSSALTAFEIKGSTSSIPSSRGPEPFYWGAMILGWMLAYWLRGKVLGLKGVPKVDQIILDGFSLDRLVDRGVKLLQAVHHLFERVLVRTIWDFEIPKIAKGLNRLSGRVIELDKVLSHWTQQIVGRTVSRSGSVLQDIQNGDLHWYLIFGVSTILLVLIRLVLGG